MIAGAIDARLESFYVAMPGSVLSFDSDLQAISVQPLYRKVYYDENGDVRYQTLPAVQGVPLVFPGMGDWFLSFPVRAGDTVLLIVPNCDMDKWLAGESVATQDSLPNLADAIAIPGLRRFSAPIPAEGGGAGYSEDYMVLGRAGGAAVAVDNTEVRLGTHDADDPVALRSDLAEFKGALAGAIITLTEAGPAMLLPLAALEALRDALPPGWPTCAQYVKGK